MIGQLMRLQRASGFKLAVVEGAAAGGDARVRLWRAAGRCWTLPQRRPWDQLTELTDAEQKKHRLTIERARAALAQERRSP